jgi:hypothetical protein
MNKQINSVFNRNSILMKYALISILILSMHTAFAQKEEPWLHFTPPMGQSNGKYIVLIGGDEAYRSEESLPMLAKFFS